MGKHSDRDPARYHDVLPAWFRTAVGLEEAADLIRAYQPQVIPGLLQTEGYVRAITAASFPAATPDYNERTVALRLERQQLLHRPGPPGYWVVMDETALRRPIGGHKVMRDQIRHLIQAAEQPNVTIQVIPFAAGWHPALYGMFNIYRFPDDQLPGIVYTESLIGAYYLSKPDEAARYIEARHPRHQPRHRRLGQTVERQRRRLPGSQEAPRRPGRATPVHRPQRPRPHPGTE